MVRSAAPLRRKIRGAAASADRADEAIGAPRYQQIFVALRGAIGLGSIAVGAALPTEQELCAQFGVSRFTVREALRRLVDIGLIERRKGSGSCVIARTAPANVMQSMRSLSELFQYALDTRFDITSVETRQIDVETAELLASEPGTEWLVIDGVRREIEGSAAICYTRAHVEARFAPLLHDVRTLRAPIYAAVEERSGERVTESVQDMRAVRMPAEVAQALGPLAEDWAMLVMRRYIGRDGVLVCSLNWHPAARFRYTIKLQRGDIALRVMQD